MQQLQQFCNISQSERDLEARNEQLQLWLLMTYRESGSSMVKTNLGIGGRIEFITKAAPVRNLCGRVAD